MPRFFCLTCLGTVLLATPVLATELHADMASTGADGAGVGTVDVADSPGGAIFHLHLHGLPPGPHGFHLHQNGSCAPAPGKDGTLTPAGAAGGHYDPVMTGMHMGPDGSGHLGDLPFVTVAADGTMDGAVTAPRVKDISALRDRALVIHVGGDNYSDTPAPLGGGGGRLACGVLN